MTIRCELLHPLYVIVDLMLFAFIEQEWNDSLCYTVSDYVFVRKRPRFITLHVFAGVRMTMKSAISFTNVD